MLSLKKNFVLYIFTYITLWAKLSDDSLMIVFLLLQEDSSDISCKLENNLYGMTESVS